MVTATPHEDVEAAYGQDREEQLVLDLMRDAALCCRERHSYMPTNEEERRSFTPHLWVMEGASEYANHAYAEGRKDEREAINVDGLLTAVRALPFVNAPEIDGEESDGTPRHYRSRRFVSLTKLESLLREWLGDGQ